MTRGVLVTGGSRGIGAAIARAFADHGDRVAVHHGSSTDAANAVVDSLSGEGHTVVQADMTDPDAVRAAVDAAADRLGRLDVLVNNAGVAPDVRADILDATPESFDRLIGINLRGPYFLTQSAARWMIDQRRADPTFRGCVVNVSSVSATVASVNRGDYCLSKAGVAMATKLWAARLAEFGVDVYEVRPGVIATDMTAGVKQKYDALIEGGLTLEQRWGTPEDVGNAVAVLARGELPYATGQVLNIDGGATVRRL